MTQSKMSLLRKGIFLIVALTFIILPNCSLAYNKSWDQGHKVCVVEPGTSNWGKFDDNGVFHGGYGSKECCELLCKVCPVYANTGQLQKSFTDLKIPGVGPVLSITRTYNSQDWATSLLGNGWTFNFGRRLIITRNNDGTKRIGVLLETGEKNYYIEELDGNLTRLTGYGARYELFKNSDNTYTLHKFNGMVYELREDGKIAKVVDKNQNEVVFSYNSVGCLSRITNASANYVDFQLGPNGKISSISDNFGRTIIYSYDERGNLTSVSDPLGNTSQYVYNSKNLLTHIIDARGNVVETAAYDNNNPPRVSTFTEKGETFSIAYYNGYTEKTDSQGNKWTFYFNDVGVIERVINPLGHVQQKQLNKVTTTSMDWEEDANGNRTTFTYDLYGNITTKTDPLGNTWSYTYISGSDLVETETDPTNIVTRYKHDANGNVTSKTMDADGSLSSSTTYTYDSNGNKTSVTDPLGNQTAIEYDANGKITRATGPLGEITIFTYDERGNQLTETDPLGNTVSYSYDLMDRIVSVADALGNSVGFAYDANGNKISRTDEKGQVTKYVYDSYNRIITQTDPLGNATSFTYDYRDNKTSETDPNGKTTSYNYDILNRLIQRTDAAGNVTSYTYDAAGNMLSTTNALGQQTTYQYDAMNRLVSKVKPGNERTIYTLDRLGRVTDTVLPNNTTVHQKYDSLGRVISVSDGLITVTNEYDLNGRPVKQTRGQADATTMVYDNSGRLIRRTDANGNSVQYSHDAVGRPLQMVDPDGRTSKREYDAAGRIIAVVDPNGNRTTLVRDSAGLLVEVVYPDSSKLEFAYDAANRRVMRTYRDGSTAKWSYDSAGNIVTKTDRRGRQLKYTYNALNKKVTEGWTASGRKSNFGYDAIGRLISISNAFSSSSFAYNNAGHLAQVTQDGITIGYTHDLENSISEIVYPGGLKVREQRNAEGFIENVELVDDSIQINYTRNDVGRIIGVSYSSGLELLYGRDYTGIVKSIRHAVGDTDVYAYNISHDAVGIKKYRKNLINAFNSESYVHDYNFYLTERRIGELAGNTVPSPIETEAFEYDSNGNITRYQSGGTDEIRTYSVGNELVSVASTNVDHDDVGNMTDDGLNTYQFDEYQQLISVTRNSDGQVLMECEYDALHRRTKKITRVPAYSETIYIYDALSFRVLAELDSAKNVQKRYVWGNDLSGSKKGAGGIGGLLVMQDAENNASYGYGYDELGNVVALYDLNNSNDIAAQYTYSAFGLTTSSQGTMADANPFRFSTKIADAETDLVYFGYRYYSPRFGRWITPDPIAEMGGDNIYAFALNSPNNVVDLLGLDPINLNCWSVSVGLGGGSITLAFGPVWSDVGWGAQFSGEACTKCCDDGSTVTDASIKLSVSGTFRVAGTSWGGKYDYWWGEAEAWLGVKGEIFGTLSGEGAFGSNYCEGMPLQGKACAKGEAGGKLSVGGAIYVSDKLLGDFKAGAFGELTGSFSVEKCWECHGWPMQCSPEQAKICANAKASVYAVLPWFDFAWDFWSVSDCYPL
jgi:RHS repeat-associated protein